MNCSDHKETKIYRIDAANLDLNKEIIKEAADVIRGGGLVAFPTETVYGLGGDAFNPLSSRKIYEAKGRPSDNPLIVHIADTEALSRVAAEVSEKAKMLMERFWPGPLTLIFQKTGEVPVETTGGLETVAVRLPSDPVARAFIREAGGYIAAPSANLSGKPSPTSGKYVIQDMEFRIDMILYGEDSLIGLESTIVDMTCEPPMVLRPGYVTLEQLRETVGAVEADITLISDESNEAPKAPGMKYRHYAPKGELAVVQGNRDSVIEYINQKIALDREMGLKTGVIASDSTCPEYEADFVHSTGETGSMRDAAHRLFSILRALDDEGADKIYSEGFKAGGIGDAVMNRLLKAAGHNVVNLEKEGNV